MDELARYLTGNGHEVTTLSTKPRGAPDQPAVGERSLFAPMWTPWLGKIRIRPAHTFFVTSLKGLRALNADVVHSFYFYDSLAASLLRSRKGYRTVLQMNGVPVPGVSCYRYFPPEGRLIKAAIRSADCRICCSQFVREQVRAHYGVDSLVIAPPVNLDTWKLGWGPPDGRPTVLAVADFNERRKGIRVLVKAFQLLKNRLPEARLRLSGAMSPQVEGEVFGPLPNRIREDVEVLGLGQLEKLPGLYQEASVTALPSMWEPSGTVMMESWASGTPVAATRHAGLTEFFDEGVGRMFDPRTAGEETHNAEGLADALFEAIQLSQKDGIRHRCREHASRFSSSVVGPRIEKVYRSL